MGLTLGLGLKRIKYAHLLCCAGSSHGRNQHHEAEHASPRCSECGRQFGSKSAMEKVRVSLQASFCDRLPTLPQHYDAKHRFECTECDDEFTTEADRDQVRSFFSFSVRYRRSPLASRGSPPLDRVSSVRSRIRDPECDGSGS